MNADALKQQFLQQHISKGDVKFYNMLIVYSLNNIILIIKNDFKGTSPNIELMDYYDQFIILYRREGDAKYLQIAKLFRKAANKIYRIMLKKNLATKNTRFLNVA